MGRMLEALRQAQGRRAQAGQSVPALQTVWPGFDERGAAEGMREVSDLMHIEPDGEGTVPFIEVGGPRSRAVIEKPVDRAPVVSRAPAESRVMSVQFRPLCLEPTPGRGPARFARELVAYHQPDHPVSAQYRELARGLLAGLPAEHARVLLFTSAVAGAGTTNVLLNVAITLARQENLRVIVVDAHLRRPAVASRLGLADAPGLREVLAGRLPLESAVRASGLPGLSALTAGIDETTLPGRLAGEAMRSVLRHLRAACDVVLVDGPRWDGRPEVVALGCSCDAVYLCLPEAEQEAPETVDLLQIIPEQGAHLCGCILTGR
jgi:Mrp family chromosome partitioning ATPase